MTNYILFAIIGKSGSGKDTLLHEILDQRPSFHRVVSCTTRPKRDYEEEGKDYFFLTAEEFAKKLLNQEMLEAACFNDWFYGTTEDSFSPDHINIGVFNPDAIEALMLHKNILLYTFYIEATDKQRLIRQLNRVEDPDIDEIIRRYKAEKIEHDVLNFNYNSINNNTTVDFEAAVNLICRAADRVEEGQIVIKKSE